MLVSPRFVKQQLLLSGSQLPCSHDKHPQLQKDYCLYSDTRFACTRGKGRSQRQQQSTGDHITKRLSTSSSVSLDDDFQNTEFHAGVCSCSCACLQPRTIFTAATVAVVPLYALMIASPRSNIVSYNRAFWFMLLIKSSWCIT